MTLKEKVRGGLERVPGAVTLARLTLETVRVCLRYRVTGLASEAAFFMLLSLPPLVLGLFGGAGYVGLLLGPDSVARLVAAVSSYASQFLTESSIEQLILPTVEDVLRDGRPDLVSVGFLLSLWSGSRALNVFVDTVSIMYGQNGVRGIVRTRMLSLALYSLGILVAVVVMPLVLLGPSVIQGWLPDQLKVLTLAYWPIVLVVSIAALTTLYHISTPRRASWWRNLPGALLALALWLVSSFVVRSSLEASLGGATIYGPLSTPIVLLIWLYALAIAILIGAGLNSATRVLWPVVLYDGTGTRLAHWAGGLLARPGVVPAQAIQAEEGDGGGPEADRRALDQQYERRERSALAEAIERELAHGMGRPKDDSRL
jgi:membrane protein